MFLNTRILELAILRGSQRQVLPTARAGNVFTGVCPSTGGSVYSIQRGVPHPEVEDTAAVGTHPTGMLSC